MNKSKNNRRSLDTNKLYVLDKDFYPDRWEDDMFMSSIMYNFRPKEVNPEYYEQKMQFWKDMIELYCDYKGSCSISINELKDVFRRKGTSPYCLSDVLNQMQSEGNLQDKISFMQKPNESWTSWTINTFIYKPANWGFSKIKEKVIGAGNQSDDTVFIVKSAVQKQARLLQEHVKKQHSYNNIISMDDLMKHADDIEGLSREGIFFALQYMSVYTKTAYIEEHQTAGENHHHKLLVKFSEPHKSVEPIKELERSIYNLEHTERFLIETIEKKESYLNSVLSDVKNCLKDGKKQMAKTYLRKKHLLESDINKTMSILDNVQAMLQRIHNSKSDKEILSAYKMGSDSIKNTFVKSGINIDNVQDIIEDMREVIEDQDEYENILSSPIRGLNDIDDSELEKELNDIINENKKPGPKDDKSNKAVEDLNLLDLEMRLKRLRSDLPDLDDETTSTTVPRSHEKFTQ
ncbi:hypothetical protein PVAND_013429 [Polypedilum vanderplanki]|uniref:Charged multivesicular body protein 7 n=1 Tax=Polypedilum vanderplanki TaxID=319348 RepID=A0A9J6CQA6_POLVA|nr:hypothetical protein PVAND_013429 [Polypedilum vanderplanki]